MSRRAVSAIVVTYQTGPRLKECLYGLAADSDIGEIVIVDNGNPPEVQVWLDRFAADRPSVRVVGGHGNIGFGAGVNLGITHAAGPHLLVINPDAVLRWNSIPALQAPAETAAAPWIVGGKIYDLFGREERGARRRELTLWRAITRVFGWNTWTLEHSPAPAGPIEIPVISGAFFLTSKDSMTVLGGFDETYFLHVEDIDLCRRCREAGGTVIYAPGAGALHYGSTSDAPNKTVARHKADSLQYYFRKNANGALEKLLVSLAMPFIRLATVLKAR